MLKLFFVSLITLLIIDLIWIGGVASSFYVAHFQNLGRIVDGKISVLYLPALFVYLFLSAALVYYVFPQVQPNFPLWKAFLIGGGFGLAVYGVYDMTNLATLKDYSVKLALVDMAWGTMLCGIVTTLGKVVRDGWN